MHALVGPAAHWTAPHPFPDDGMYVLVLLTSNTEDFLECGSNKLGTGRQCCAGVVRSSCHF